MTGVFDLDIIDDLPSELLREMGALPRTSEEILHLFSLSSEPLGMSKLVAGYFRVYGKIKKRHDMVIICYRMKKQGLLAPTQNKGEYEATNKGLALMGAAKTITDASDK